MAKFSANLRLGCQLRSQFRSQFLAEESIDNQNFVNLPQSIQHQVPQTAANRIAD